MADERRDDGGPAFPIPPVVIGEHMFDDRAADGMGLRDWFAGQIAASVAPTYGPLRLANEFRATACRSIAQAAYEMADAMLAERAK